MSPAWTEEDPSPSPPCPGIDSHGLSSSRCRYCRGGICEPGAPVPVSVVLVFVVPRNSRAHDSRSLSVALPEHSGWVRHHGRHTGLRPGPYSYHHRVRTLAWVRSQSSLSVDPIPGRFVLSGWCKSNLR